MKMMLDTNIFIIDRFFQRDERFSDNKRFIKQCSGEAAYFSIFSLFELTGIASFNLSEKELIKWFFDFENVYSNIHILNPKLQGSAKEWFNLFSFNIFENIQKKATMGDAFILMEAINHDMDAIITWNKKDFENRFDKEVLTPINFLYNQNSKHQNRK
ncbi:hypothetical protein MHK_003952 [Candidatus Magnetomorum sp. HK-1]|nr:hypothetical protein MHK_003952 [Candidatus Magnetomorum sp. HK-1]